MFVISTYDPDGNMLDIHTFKRRRDALMWLVSTRLKWKDAGIPKGHRTFELERIA